MRKLLTSVAAVGVLAVPATLAFAAENDNEKIEAAALVSPRAELNDVDRSRDRNEGERLVALGTPVEQGGGVAAAAPAPAPAPAAPTSGTTASPQLGSIAACESGGDPSAVSPDGLYRGKYQFSYETWASVGGSGDPAAAPESEQDMRAQTLLNQAGTSPWPNCG